MKKYFAPALVNYGLSSQQIKGTCGWGDENFWLDKDGFYEFTRKNYIDYTGTIVCDYETVCSTSQPPDLC